MSQLRTDASATVAPCASGVLNTELRVCAKQGVVENPHGIGGGACSEALLSHSHCSAILELKGKWTVERRHAEHSLHGPPSLWSVSQPTFHSKGK